MSASATVPEGYKQTEIGIFPKDWMIGNLDTFIQVIDCKHITPKFVELGIPLASIGEVKNRFVDLTHANHTTPEFYNLLISGGRKPSADDLILSRNATVGEVSQVTLEHPTFAMGQDVVLLRKRSIDFSSSLIQEILESFIVRAQLENCMVGSTFRRVNVKQIKELIISLPRTKIEQHVISSILTETNILIEQLEKYIKKKRYIIQGTMQKLLTGRTRLPGFSDDWVKINLSHIARIEKGKQLDRNDVDENGLFPHYNGGVEPSNYTNIWNAAENQIIISEGGNSCGHVQFVEQNFWLGGHCYLVSKSKINKSFLFWALKSVQSKIMRLRVGSGLPNVQKSALMDFEIIYPCSEREQETIAEVLSDMDAEIAALEERLEKAKTIKQGMMQQLLTGNIRLID